MALLPRLASVITLTLTLALVSACGDDATTILPNDSSSAVTTEPTPTATLPPIPDADRQLVDAVVQALQTQSIEAIRPFVGFRHIACIEEAAAEGPPICRDGETPGAEVDAFYFSDCAGHYVRPDALDQPLDVLASLDVAGVYRVPRRTESGYQYAVVLTDTADDREGMAWEAIVESGQIIGLLYSCSLDPERLVELRGYVDQVPTPAPIVPTPAA